jgi:14-3-3 protein epsilon
MLNYSVFLDDIIGKRQEAIERADNTFKDATDFREYPYPESHFSDALQIVQLLNDNVRLWIEESAG